MSLSLDMVQTVSGVPVEVRVSNGASHYVRTAGDDGSSVRVKVCGGTVDLSAENARVGDPLLPEGTTCKRCVRIVGRLAPVLPEPVSESVPCGDEPSDTDIVAVLDAFIAVQAATRHRLMEAGVIRRADGKRFVLQGEPLTQKCVNPQTGMPVTGVGKENAVFPVGGSVRPQGDGSSTGTCPLCGAHVKVSSITGGVVGHMMRREPSGKAVGLSEPNLAPVETGNRQGAPESGSKRVAAVVDGAFERGTVPQFDPETLKPVKDDDGVQCVVPAVLDNIEVALRAALRAGQRLRQRKSETTAEFTARVRANAALVAKYRLMRDAALAGPSGMLDAGPLSTESVTTDAAGRVVRSGRDMSPGPAMVRGKQDRPLAGDVVVWHQGEDRPEDVPLPEDRRKGWSGRAGTMAEPLGRVRLDHGAASVPNDVLIVDGRAVLKHGGEYGWLTREQYDTLSRGAQSRYWKTIRKRKAQARQAQEEAKRRRKAQRERGVGREMTGTGTGALGTRVFVHDGYEDAPLNGVPVGKRREGRASALERLMRQPRS